VTDLDGTDLDDFPFYLFLIFYRRCFGLWKDYSESVPFSGHAGIPLGLMRLTYSEPYVKKMRTKRSSPSRIFDVSVHSFQ